MELVKSPEFVKISNERKLTKENLEFVEGTKEAPGQAEIHLKGEIELVAKILPAQ